MKSYILTSTNHPYFDGYCGRKCHIEFFRDPDMGLLRATLMFPGSMIWAKTNILTMAPKHDGDKMVIHTLNSSYYFKELKEESV